MCGKSDRFTAHPSVDIYSFGVMVRLILTQLSGGKAQLLPGAWRLALHVSAHVTTLWICGSEFRCRSHYIRATAAEVYSTQPNGTPDSLGGAVLFAGARAAQHHSRRDSKRAVGNLLSQSRLKYLYINFVFVHLVFKLEG